MKLLITQISTVSASHARMPLKPPCSKLRLICVIPFMQKPHQSLQKFKLGFVFTPLTVEIF
jgi:hypothetical protein